MLELFAVQPGEALTCLPLWRDPPLLPAPEVSMSVPITPNRLASVFRTHVNKRRNRNKTARNSRRKNRR